eukprot:g554.t1
MTKPCCALKVGDFNVVCTFGSLANAWYGYNGVVSDDSANVSPRSEAPILGGFHLFYCSPPELRVGLVGLGGITRWAAVDNTVSELMAEAFKMVMVLPQRMTQRASPATSSSKTVADLVARCPLPRWLDLEADVQGGAVQLQAWFADLCPTSSIGSADHTYVLALKLFHLKGVSAPEALGAKVRLRTLHAAPFSHP